MSKGIKSSVILPTYNEAGNIVKLVEAIRSELAVNKIIGEVIVVDDDSPDKTGLLAQKYFSKVPEVRVIIRKKEKGLASAIRKGLELAVGEIVVVMDTDFNHEPKLVPKLILKCNKYDMVIGSRYVKGGGMDNKKRELLSYLYNLFLIKPLISSPVNDNLSGFFAIRHNQLEKLNYDKIFFGYGDYFIRLIYYANQQGNSFTQIPSFYHRRTYGESKSNFFTMAKEYFLTALKLRLGL